MLPAEPPPLTGSVRLAHFSDLHLTTRPIGFRSSDFLSRRTTGWVNWYVLGRAKRFRDAVPIGQALVADIVARGYDRAVFSGDATYLGFPGEMALAAEVLHVDDPRMPPGLAVPGNHDWYTAAAVRSGVFEHVFGPWQKGTRIGSESYPFAQQAGPFWLVGVNSAAPTWMPMDASGRVGTHQLERLRRLLRELPAGPRIMVTHYPVHLASGEAETRWHGLRDVTEVVRVAGEGGVRLWLHGHRHGHYVLPATDHCPFPTIGAGSVAQSGRAGYMDLTLDRGDVYVQRRVYDPTTGRFADGERFELALGP